MTETPTTRDEQQEQKQHPDESQQDIGSILTFICGGFLGAALQSLVFRQWVLAEVELAIMVLLLIGVLARAVLSKRGEKRKA